MNSDRFDDIASFAALNFNVPPAHVPRDEMFSRIRLARDLNNPQLAVPRETIWQGVALVRSATRGFSAVRSKVGFGGRRIATRTAGGSRWRGRGGWALLPATALAAYVFVALVDVEGPGPARNIDLALQGGPVQASMVPQFGVTGLAFAGYSQPVEPWMDFAAAFDPASEAYRRAAISHLSRSEAFIAGFRSQNSGAATGRDARTKVRELLSTTRQLIDSPLSARTQFKPVFLDLELVLARIALVNTSTFSEDRDLIEATLEKKKLLPRMRELIPQISTSNAN